MDANLQHSIGRQVVECQASMRGEDAHTLQERISRLCREVLPGVLEAALDRHAPAGEVLRIEKLTIDLGRISLAGLEAELAGRLHARLAESLRQLSSPAARQVPGGTGNAEPAALDAALAWFLRYGTLPAWCRLPSGASLAAALREHWRGQPALPASAAFRSMLRKALDDAGAGKRLATQFDPGFRRALLEYVHQGAGAQLDRVMAVLVRTAPAAAAGQLLPALEVAALRLALDRIPLDPVPLAAAALASQPAGSPARPVLQAFVDRHPASRSPEGREARAGRHASPAAEQPPPAPAEVAQAHPDQTGGLAVRQAGVVLLHPFLPRLFEALGIGGGGRLLLPDRALALLHFLATGERQAPEHELALAKLLCGLPLTAAPDGGVVLRDAECAEGEAMLAAAIVHWGALRNTTPDGLRGAFLLRPGVLWEHDGEWRLRVQAETADILLDSLPWGVGAVRLPWMRGILWVEWR